MYLFAPIRILVTNMSQFANKRRDVMWHIPSRYEDEMAKKSTVVSCRYAYIYVHALRLLHMYNTS